MKNIGIVFVKMGQYADAITTYEHIMSDKPDVETGTIYLVSCEKPMIILEEITLIWNHDLCLTHFACYIDTSRLIYITNK